MGRAGAHSASAPPPLLLLLLLLLRAERLRGAELTFELPDSAKQCFHEDVEQGAKFSLDYQVRPAPAAPCRWSEGRGRARERTPVGRGGRAAGALGPGCRRVLQPGQRSDWPPARRDSKGRQRPVPDLWGRFVPCVLTPVSGEGMGSWFRSPPFSPSTARSGVSAQRLWFQGSLLPYAAGFSPPVSPHRPQGTPWRAGLGEGVCPGGLVGRSRVGG